MAKCKICKKVIWDKDIEQGYGIKINYKGVNMYFCCEEHCGEYIKALKVTELYFKERDDIDRYVKGNIFFYKDGQKLPKAFFDRLADLHNGTDRGREGAKEIKNGNRNGYPMPVILDTFKSQRDAILYSFRNKSFKNESQKLNYMWKIIEGNINDEYERWKASKRLEVKREAIVVEQDVVDRMYNEEVVPKPTTPNTTMDLSWALEDFDD